MKHHGRSLVALLALVFVLPAGAQDAPKPAPVSDETAMIADLRAGLAGIFQYGSWNARVVVTKSGLAVLGGKGAQGNGGLGREIAPVVSFSDVQYVELALGTIPGNEVPQVTIALNDADGTQFSARVPVEQLVPGQPVWLRARREDFRLNDVERGTDAQMDWNQVARWHLQGDWTTMKPMCVIFVALRVRR